MCLLIGQGGTIGALLCTSNFLHPRHSSVPCIMQNTFFTISAIDVDHIDMYPAGAIVSFQGSGGTVVLAKILGPSERGADYRSITYEHSGCMTLPL